MSIFFLLKSFTKKTIFVLLFLALSTNSAIAADLGPEPAGINQVQNLYTRVVNISVGAAFVALVVVLVITGIKFITSGGDAKSISAASQAIVWGLLGILFLALAWISLQLIAAFTGRPELLFFNLKILCDPKGC